MKLFVDPNELPQLGTNQTGMRAYNEKLVLTILRNQGAMSKAEIAKLTGLSAQTVSVIMRELESEGLLIKGKPVRGKVGQPSVPLALNPDGALFYGLKIGRRSAEVVLIDFSGQVRAHERIPYPYPKVDAVIEFAREQIQKFAKSMSEEQRSRVAGLGVAMPFELWSWARVIGVDPEQMAQWRDFDIVSALGEHFDFPVYLQNDGSAACGAELTFGTQNHPRDFLYFYIGYFAGGGIVLDGKLYTGPSGNAGAIGSMIILNADGEPVQLLETSSIATLERGLKRRQLGTEEVWDHPDNWKIDQAILDEWIEINASGLAQAIIESVAIIDFEAVVIDGWLPDVLRAQLVRQTEIEFKKRLRPGLTVPNIVEGTLGPMARPLGAASLPLTKRFILE